MELHFVVDDGGKNVVIIHQPPAYLSTLDNGRKKNRFQEEEEVLSTGALQQ